MRSLLSIPTVLATLFVAAPAGRAEDPAIILQTTSLNEGVGVVTKFLKSVDPKLAQEFETGLAEGLKQFGNLKGFDRSKKIGMYASIAPILPVSPVVILIPATEDKAFLTLLSGVGFKTEEQRETPGVYLVAHDELPIPFYLRFQKGYAYIGYPTPNIIDPAKALAPEQIFDAGDKSIVSLKLRPALVPQGLRKQAEQGVVDGLKAAEGAAHQPMEKAAAKYLAGSLVPRWTKQLLFETKEIVLRLEADSATGSIALSSTVEPLPGTSLAADLSARGPTPNAFRSLAGPDTLGQIFVRLPLFSQDLRDFAKVGLDELKNMPLPPEAQDLLDELIAGARRNVDAGEAELGIVATGPNRAGQITIVGGFTFKDTSKVEKLIKALVPQIPDPQVKDAVKFNVAKVGGFNVHSITPPDTDPMAEKLFGKGGIYVVGTDKAVFVAIGPDALQALRSAVNAKSSPTPVGHASGSLKWGLKLAESFAPPEVLKSLKEALPSNFDNVTFFQLAIDGGSKLTIRAESSAALLGALVYRLGRSASGTFQRIDPD